MEKTSYYWNRLKRHPVAYNLVLIAGIFVVAGISAHILMRFGTRHSAHRTVPDLAGIQLEEAQQSARHNDLRIVVNDSLYVPAYEGGIVLDQLPEKGVEVKPGRTVYVTINSFSQKMVTIPYVAGRSLRQAKNMLEIAGLEINKLVYRPDLATNYVLEESYQNKPIYQGSKTQAEIGSGVTLYVGVEGGYGTTVIPQLVGLPLKEAKSRLWEAGLNVGKVSFDPGITLLNQKDARIYVQAPDPERAMQLGTTVELRLTLDLDKVQKSRATSDKLAKTLAEQRIQQESEQADSLGSEVEVTTEEEGGFFD